MFELLKAQYSDMLGWAQQGMPQDRFMELELETGNTHAAVTTVETTVDGKLVELHAQLVDLFDHCRIQHLTAGHAAAVVFAQSGRVMAHLLLLSLPQCHHASCLAAAAHCSATRRHARATSSSPSSFSRVAIISYRRGHHDPTGGRQYQTSLTSFWSQTRSSASSSGRWSRSVCRDPPRC